MFKNTAVLFGLLVFPWAAYADPKDDARRHFAAGLSSAQEGDYAAALERFLAAQNAYPHPATLYNIARAYADMNELEEAISYYKLFQDAAPDKAADVAPVIRVLEARIGRDETDPAAPPTPGAGRQTTSEEIDRLQSIAAELAALSEALQTRAEEGAPPPEKAEPTPGETEEPEAGFISEAYDKLVVTASRVGQDPLDSPSTLSVVTEEDIRMSGATSIPDILRQVAGVDVMTLASGHHDVSIRGFNRKLSNKVLVLIDGRSTTVDFLGITFWATLALSPDEIERIEVIRGPGSATYGANAVTGVINIITKTPGKDSETIFRAAGGNQAFVKGSAYSSGRVGRTAYRISAGYHQLGRWAKAPTGNLESSSIEAPLSELGDMGRRTLRASARLDRSIGNKGYLSFHGGIAEASTIDFFNLGALGNFVIDDHRHHTLRADVGYDVLHLRAFWNHDQATTAPAAQLIGTRSTAARYNTDTIDLEAEAPLTFSTGKVRHVLNLGVGYRRLDVRFGYLAGGFDQPYGQNHIRGFINEELSIDKLKVVGSLRVDKHPLLKLSQTVSPRGALIYRLFEKTSVRASAGTAFRQPNNVESYMDFNLPTQRDGAYVRDFGDTTLAPERITTFEVGLHDESTFFHAADIVMTYNKVDDLIDLAPVTPSILPYDPDNNGYQVGTTGWINQDLTYTSFSMEAELETYPADGLDIHGNLALTSIQETDAAGTVTPDKSTSLVKVNVGAAYRTPYRLDISADVSWVSAQTWRLREFDANGDIVLNEAAIPARTLLTARVAGRPLADNSFELALGVWNALALGGVANRFREHPTGHPVAGIAFGEVSYAF